MAQTRTLQRRIRSVRNAKQITKALEVVAASRMRRVVAAVNGVRTYGEMAEQIMQRVAANPEVHSLPYFAPASSGPTLYVIVTSDRGQAGAFNSNVFNLAISSFQAEKTKPQVVVFGRKGSRFFSHLDGLELRGTFEDIADTPEANVFASLMDTIASGLASGEFGQVKIIYTQFISSLAQKATSFQLFPVQPATDEAQASAKTVYEFEPEVQDVVEEAVRLYTEAKLIQARIESAASEHAMRMVAMGNANRNATDLIDSLTLELNATRQAAITQEIAEITGGAEALST
ncbi:MAG TPA: ATP synthase F1 subunit gamma [Candidatus Binatia bacterium]|nr:ATP synthase F1 subunit gamma [Candidatus Binatia bacterium]